MITLNNKQDLAIVLNEIEALAIEPNFIKEAAKLAPKYGITCEEWNTNKPYILYLLASKIILNKN